VASLIEFEQALLSISSRDDQQFSWAVRTAVNLLQLSHLEIAEKFGISRPSVTRWINGKNFPHPALRPVIYRWLADQAAERITSFRQAHPEAA